MVEKNAIEYVRKAVKKGFSFDDIAKLLKKYGYKQRDIDESIWVVSRELRAKEEKKTWSKKSGKKRLEMPPHPDISLMPEMPKHIKPKHKPIHEVEKKAEEKIQQKFFPKKEKKARKHAVWVILEIIGGIILFAIVGILMYLFLWPVLLNVK